MKLTLAILGALALVACSSSAPPEEEGTMTADGADGEAPIGSSLPSGPGGPGTGTPETPGPPGPSGTDAGADAAAAADAAPPIPNTGPGAFAGVPAYVSTLGPSTLDTRGQGNGHLAYNAQGNPAGRDCLLCHTGNGKAPAFLFGGTVYGDAAGTKVVARAEVRMVGADGKGASAYTDDNGNYFFRAGGPAIVAPAIAGLRNATVSKLMKNKINNGACNSCHGAKDRITL